MHIRIINPTVTARWNENTQRTYANAARAGVDISVVSLDWGPPSIEAYRDIALAVPGILTKVIQAEQEGVNAVVIDCMADPGLDAARELVNIPVVGPAQASMHLAAVLGHHFSVLTVFDQDIPQVEEQVAHYGLSGQMASVRAFNIPVLALEDNPEATMKAVLHIGEQAVREDGADVIIPGCTGLAGLASKIQAGLAERGCEAPVLDPPSVALKLAESLIDLGQAHSKRAYPPPPAKKIVWPVETLFGR